MVQFVSRGVFVLILAAEDLMIMLYDRLSRVEQLVEDRAGTMTDHTTIG